ncbi:MAG: cyclic nucleotide-binding domain-containing protein [Myxococcota bacterium]|jgi:CRP-like cAMP-binding protein|nr:cyclic nucleotide-binding domain-containing protein [Myxococcota bacterium]
MQLAQARSAIEAHVRSEFGKIVQLGEVVVTRSAAGRVFKGALLVHMRSAEVRVGSIGLNEDGVIVEAPTPEELIEVFAGLLPGAHHSPLSQSEAQSDAICAELDEFSEELGTSDDGLLTGDDLDSAMGLLDPDELQGRVLRLLAAGRSEDIAVAQGLLPRLLSDADRRPYVLKQMGELELHLGAIDRGIEYLLAAARELADRADIDQLDRVAEIVLQTLGSEEFATHPIRALLNQTHLRLHPLERLAQSPVFAGLAPNVIAQIESIAEQRLIRAGEDILKEGASAVQAFVIRSGVLSVRLEAPDGSSRIVRSCFPGELLGESSVLGGVQSTCSATVRAERLSSIWLFNGGRLAGLTKASPALRARIESARSLHRLDSFLSMSGSGELLDTAWRDRLLSSVIAVRFAMPGEVLGVRGALPTAVYLIAQGKLEYRVKDQDPVVMGADSFAGLRDTLHALPLEGELVAVEPTRLVVFEPAGLREMAAGAPPEVVAVLERMG